MTRALGPPQKDTHQIPSGVRRPRRILSLLLDAVLSTAPGGLVFLWIFAPMTNPARVDWVFADNAATADLATSQLGWMYFQQDQWRWPLGTNPSYGGNIANSIVYSDTLPALAVPLKLAFSWWPDQTPSQIAGLSVLFCLLITSASSYFLLRRWRLTRSAAFVGAFFFASTPRLLTAWTISSVFQQWVIVVALLVMSLDLRPRRRILLWSVLLLVTSGISPYLSAALIVMAWGDFIVRGLARASWLYSLIGSLSVVVCWLIGFYVWGAFSLPMSSQPTGEALGTYSANLLSLVDPGPFSRLLADIRGGASSGFGYVGAGVLILLLVGSGVGLARRFRRGNSARTRLAQDNFRQSAWAISIATIPLFIFSLLPVVSMAGASVSLPLPEFGESVLHTFRANERMMWPLMYATILAAVVLGFRAGGRRGTLFLAGALVLQVVELSPLFVGERSSIMQMTSQTLSSQDDLNRILASPRTDEFHVVPAYPYPPGTPWREVGLAAFKAGLPLDSLGPLSRYDVAALSRVRARGIEQLTAKEVPRGGVYMVSDELFQQLVSTWDEVEEVLELDGWHFVRLT